MNQYVSQGVFDRRVKLIEEKLKNIYDNDLLNRLQAEQEEFIKRLKEIELDGSIPDYFIADYNAFKANTLRIDSAFDSDGQFDGSRIQPNTVSTAALTVGQRSQQLSLTGVEFSVTPYSHSGGYYGTLEWSGGSMFHYGFINENSEPKVYTITSGSFALGNSAYYIYAYIANLEITTTTAEIKVSTNQIKVNGEGKPSNFPNGYYVQLGYVSVELDSGSSESSNRYYRKVDTTYGQTTINGRLITTGRIEGSSGANHVYFDLDKGEIGGTIKFTSGNEELDIDDYLETKYTDIYEYVLGDSTTGIQKIINDVKDELEGQIDGRIDTWFGNVQPGPNVYPENEWTTTSDKDNHLGDLYYDDSTGYAYRYTKNGNNYTWNKIEDTDMTRALAIAKSAKETADGKMSVFLDDPSNPPIPPYSEGDMWVNATYPKTGTKTYNDETLVCIDRHFESCANSSYSQSTIYYKIENNEYVVDDEVTSENFNTKKSSLYKQIFNIADWQSSNRAIAEVDNVTNDGIISKGSEKASLKKEFEEITGTYNKALDAITTFGVSSEVTNEKDDLDDAYDALSDVMDIILDDTNEDTSISSDLNMTKQEFRDLWVSYYSAEATLNDAIQKAAQDKIEAGVDAAKAELLAINNGTTTIAGGMITNNLLELKNIVGVTKQFKSYVSGRQYYKRISNVTSGGSTVARFLTVSTGSTYPNYNLYEEAEQGDVNTISGIAVSSESQTTGTSKIFKGTEFYYGGGTPGFVTAGLSGIEDFPCYWSGGDEVLARNYINFKKAWDAAPSPYNASLKDYEWDKSNKDFIYDYDEVEPDHSGHPNKTFPVWKKESTNPVKHIKANFITALSRYEKYIRNATKYDGANSNWTTIDSSSDIPRLPVVIIDFNGFCKFGDFYVYESQVYYNNASGFGHYALTLNGTQNGSGTSLGSFYAPTSGGTSGNVLIWPSSGSIPSWTAQSNLSVGSAGKATTTADTSNTLYPIGVTSSATTTLKRDTGITFTNGVINAAKLRINTKSSSSNTNGGIFYYNGTTDYLLIGQGSSNLWIGANETAGTHHVGSTYISSGDGETYISRLVNNTRTNYKVLDAGNTYVSSNKGYINGTEITTITGNAATATKLGTSTVGATNNPIYLNSGVATVCGIFPTLNPTGETAISLNDDLNTYTTPGVFGTTGGHGGSTIAASLSNCPLTTGFKMIVQTCGNDGTYLRQTINAKNGQTFVRTASSSNSVYTWGSWKHFPTSTVAAVGSTTNPVYVDANGDINSCTYSLSSTVNAGTANRLAYYTSSGIDDASTTYVSNTKLAINSIGEPSYNFYVDGTANITTSALINNITVSSNTISSGSILYLDSAASTSLIFRKGTTEMGRWNSSSNLIVGTPSNPNNITNKLYVNGTSKLVGDVDIYNNSGSDIGLTLNRNTNASWKILNTGGKLKFLCNWTSSLQSSYSVNSITCLYGSGNVGIGTDSPTVKLSVAGDIYASGGVTALQTVTSDKRFKKNIKKFEAKDIIEKLQPVEFEWNSKAKKYSDTFKDGKNYGLIAQDSDGIIDNLVFDLPDCKGYKGVRYEKLIPILLQAVKEQQKEIDELKSIVKQLKNK